MRSRRIGRKLGRKTSHRLSMLNNLVMDLFCYGRIKTTVAKAKDAGRVANKLITKAKKGDIHNRRLVAKTISRKDILKKLFDEIANDFKETNGSCIRVLKLAPRRGDGADMAILELLNYNEQVKEAEVVEEITENKDEDSK